MLSIEMIISSWCVIVHFSIICMLYKPLFWKVTFPVSSKPTYSSHSFQPTGIGLGSLWRGNMYVYSIHSANLIIFFFFYICYNCSFCWKKNMLISKHSITFVIPYNLKKMELGYIFAKYNNLKFSISLKSYE